ncbi:hypothetical protein EC988_001543, partial [Linderina pennispora]
MPEAANTHEMEFTKLDSIAQTLQPVIRYVVAVTALASANHPTTIDSLVRYCKAQLTEDEMTEFVAKSRESLVKMISTMGAPRVINATGSLMNAVGEDIASKLLPVPIRSKENATYDEIRERGLQLWNVIYGAQANKLENKLKNMYPDLAEVIQVDIYGRLLSNTDVLTTKETELCTIASLVPMDVPAQLKSHTLGAGRVGASADEVEAVVNSSEL